MPVYIIGFATIQNQFYGKASEKQIGGKLVKNGIVYQTALSGQAYFLKFCSEIRLNMINSLPIGLTNFKMLQLSL